MKAKHRNETERLVWEHETIEKFFEGELPVTETITERIIEHEPTVIERADEELKAAEAEHRAREAPQAEVENDYSEPADEQFWDEYEEKVNSEQPRQRQAETPKSESPRSRPTIEDRMEGEKPIEAKDAEIKEELEELPTEDLEAEKQAKAEETIDELANETDIEIPETDIELPDESDTEVGPEVEWDVDYDADQDSDQNPEYDY